MSLIDKKKKIYGTIAANKTLTESMPKFKLSSSLPSINNDNNSITFLTDLIKVLVGYGVLIDSFVTMLSTSLDSIEIEVKKSLKVGLKNIISCGVNPKIPSFIRSNGEGLTIEVSKIDFTDIMKVNPTSVSGKLLYDDNDSGLNSTDFNTFLFYVIQEENTLHSWKNMLDFKFQTIDPNGINPNNCLIIKTNASYDEKFLSDLTNNFIDSIKLFNTKNILTKITDTIFGSVSVKLKKTKKQIESEAKIDLVIDKMVNNQYEYVDDTYFVFDNNELVELEEQAENRSKGIIKIDTEETFSASVPEEFLTSFNKEYSVAITEQDKKKILSNKLDEMAESTTLNSPNEQDKQTIKLNFIQGVTDNLIKGIINSILSPKVIIIFLIIFKIVNGNEATFDNGVDFIKKNKAVVNPIIKRITKIIVDFLLVIVLKKISELVANTKIAEYKEKYDNKITQTLSLLGTPTEVIRKIKGML